MQSRLQWPGLPHLKQDLELPPSCERAGVSAPSEPTRQHKTAHRRPATLLSRRAADRRHGARPFCAVDDTPTSCAEEGGAEPCCVRALFTTRSALFYVRSRALLQPAFYCVR